MSFLRNIVYFLRRLSERTFPRKADTPRSEIVETLRGIPLFQHFPEDALRELAEFMHRRDYRREEFLYFERDPGMGLYIIQHGRVRLLTEDEDGGVHELRQVGACELIGELSILGDLRRMESAQAITEVRVLGFFSPDLKTILKRSPRAGTGVLMALARLLAVRQAALVHLIAEDEGKVPAMRKLDRAALRVR